VFRTALDWPAPITSDKPKTRVGNLACVLFLGETRRAIEYHEQRSDCARDRRPAREMQLWQPGHAYRPGETACDRVHEQALAISREIGDRLAKAQTWATWALRIVNWRPRRAIKYYEQALAIDREVATARRRQSLATWAMLLGLGRDAACDRVLTSRPRDCARDRDRRSEGICLCNLGDAYLDLSKHTKPLWIMKQH